MKRVLNLMLIVLSLTINAQVDNDKKERFISVSLYQDVNLAFFEDDNGIEPFTTDIILKVKLADNEVWGIGYSSVNVLFEYADLADSWKGDFIRYGVEYGFTLAYCRLFGINFEATPSLGFSVIRRSNDVSRGAFQLCGELSFKPFDNIPIRINSFGTLMTRPDLDKGLQPNGYIGFEYRF